MLTGWCCKLFLTLNPLGLLPLISWVYFCTPVRPTMRLSSWLWCVWEFRCKAQVPQQIPVCFMGSKTLKTHHKAVQPTTTEVQIWVIWPGYRCSLFSSIWYGPTNYDSIPTFGFSLINALQLVSSLFLPCAEAQPWSSCSAGVGILFLATTYAFTCI